MARYEVRQAQGLFGFRHRQALFGFRLRQALFGRPMPAALVTLALLAGCGPSDGELGDMPANPATAPEVDPPTPARVEQELEARVTAEVFSGRPNPEWTLSPEESDELSQRMGFLAVTAAGPPPQGLGYRGVVVRVEATNSVGAASLRAYGNTIYYTVDDLASGAPNITPLHDASGTMEDWLLSTGKPHMDAETYAAVEAAIAAAHPDAGDGSGDAEQGTEGGSGPAEPEAPTEPASPSLEPTP